MRLLPRLRSPDHRRGRRHRRGELAMASGRPRRPNDPSVLASVETAGSSTVRPGILGFCWHWRYELILAAGLPGTVIAIGFTLGIAWLVAVAVTGCTLFTVAMTWR